MLIVIDNSVANLCLLHEKSSVLKKFYYLVGNDTTLVLFRLPQNNRVTLISLGIISVLM